MLRQFSTNAYVMQNIKVCFSITLNNLYCHQLTSRLSFIVRVGVVYLQGVVLDRQSAGSISQSLSQ